MIWGIVFFELVILWFTSRFVFQGVYDLLTQIGLRRKGAVYTLALLFLPGTIVHELAHLLTAEVLGVRTGHFMIFPREHEGHIKMGSVQIERTDPVRSFLIGIAPIILGLLSFVGIFFGIQMAVGSNLTTTQNSLVLGIGGYALFVIVNTMFSSRKDLEACLEFLGLVLIVMICFLIFGRGYWGQFERVVMSEIIIVGLGVLGKVLLFPVVVNIVITVFGKIAQKIRR